MNYGDDQNPYAPPSQIHDGGSPSSYGDDEMQFLASRLDRFLARLVDGLLAFAFMIPWFLFLSSMDWISLVDFKRSNFAVLKLLPAELPIAIYQWMLVARTGQTIGKKWMRIRIVRVEGSPVSKVRLWGLATAWRYAIGSRAALDSFPVWEDSSAS